jgi:hypothetical protein
MDGDERFLPTRHPVLFAFSNGALIGGVLAAVLVGWAWWALIGAVLYLTGGLVAGFKEARR